MTRQKESDGFFCLENQNLSQTSVQNLEQNVKYPLTVYSQAIGGIEGQTCDLLGGLSTHPH